MTIDRRSLNKARSDRQLQQIRRPPLSQASSFRTSINSNTSSQLSLDKNGTYSSFCCFCNNNSSSVFVGTKWRIIQWLLFVALIIGVAIGCHSLIQKSEEDDFEQAFQLTADHALQDMEDSTKNTFSLMQTFSLSVSANVAPPAWPYVTIPQYNLQVDNYVQQSHNDPTTTVIFVPLVDSPTGWERYCTQDQRASDITTFAYKVVVDGQTAVEEVRSKKVQDFNLVDGYLAPVWQIASLSSSSSSTTTTTTTTDDDDSNFNGIINYNLFQIPWISDLLRASMKDGQAKLSRIMNPEEDEYYKLPGLLHLPPTKHSNQNTTTTASSSLRGPWSLLVQPIILIDDNNDLHQQHQVGGFLLSVIPWGSTLFAHQSTRDDISNNNGHKANKKEENDDEDELAYLCVLREQEQQGETSLNDNKDDDLSSFTYRVEGSRVTYLGQGDSWVEKDAYDGGSSSSSSRSNPDQQRRLLLEATPTTSAGEMMKNPFPFIVEVYPTQEYHDSFISNQAAIATTLVVLLILVVALVFLIFQHYHDRESYEQDLVNQELNGFGGDQRQYSTLSLLSKVSGRSRGDKKNKGLPENNKQLLNVFLADQKRSHDLMGLEGSALLDDSLERAEKNTNTHRTEEAAIDSTMGGSHHSYTSSGANLTHHSHVTIPTENYVLPAWQNTKAVADLFPNASVMFADISGFTAWSSVREPSQAFSLLETLYFAFDEIAKRRRIFKVETIGDCYTAVCGLPERRKDHAIALCYFARGCLRRFRSLTQMLEEKLGPETSELALRVGVNSGPIMAGILRGGSSARFQLFGETVTMASKIEGAGQPGRIHVSKETATQLADGGKGHWLLKREEKIKTSKGELQTFWLLDDVEARLRQENPRKLITARTSELSEDSMGNDNSGWSGYDRPEHAPTGKHSKAEEDNSKIMRLVGWNCEIMIPLLKMIVARRAAESKKAKNGVHPVSAVTELEAEIGCHNNVLDEVEEVISLPHYNAKVQQKIKSDPEKVELGESVEAELRDYVYVLANLYHPNPFHNFEHASHVTMSTMKLLSRIVAPEEVIECSSGKTKKDVASQLHDSTYGITSDPLTQFAVILAALIHDVDHRGVPNFILCKEEKELAAVYDNKSVAEQNSVDIAWETLMDRRFSNLRKCIYANEAELKRFRVLLVNCVMSTDIFDKQLSALRKARWEKAFSVPDDVANAEDINRKATIVIEHLIQASDVSHTMQHWHIYTKWNERLFHEMYSAYRRGRADKDPTEGWYKGEIWFFDNYVIPLAKKLESCGVFGVSSDEYLSYAVNNRNEWEEKGEAIVKDMIGKYSAMMDIEE